MPKQSAPINSEKLSYHTDYKSQLGAIPSKQSVLSRAEYLMSFHVQYLHNLKITLVERKYG